MSQTKAQLIDPVDGTIVNADINASAAIAGSKISPSFTANTTITAASPVLRLADSTDPQSDGGSIGKIEFFGNDGSSGGADVRSFIQTISTNSSGNAHALIIGLGESNNAPTEKVRILGDGKVGIGTSSPNQNLMVMDTIANQPQIRLETSDGGSKRLDLFVDSSSNAVISAQQSAQDIEINARNNTIFSRGGVGSEVESMRIRSDGFVNIGTTGQYAKFTVEATSQAIGSEGTLKLQADAAGADVGAGITFGNTNARRAAIVGKQESTDAIAGYLAFGTRASSGDITERMRINKDGDLCVGKTTAIGKAEIATSASEIGLTVTNDTHDSSLQILATAANKNSNIFFGDNDDGNVGRIDYDHNNNSLAFFVSGAEKARFDSSGDFSIGSSTINLTGSNRTVLNVNGTNEAALCFNRSDTITGFLFADSGEFRIQAEAGAGNLVKIRNNNGTIVHFDDDGIKFNGDTAAANGLDDYEEGTFTPTLPNGTSLTNSGAYYTKIGRFVNFYCYITALNIPNNGSQFRIGGLPFTVLNGMYGGPSAISYTGSANDSRIAALAPNTQTNDTYIYFHTTGIGEAFILTNAHFQVMNSGNLNVQGCYMTAQ